MINKGIINGHDLMKDKYTEYSNDLISYLLSYSMEQSPSWEANWFCS